MQNFRSTYRVAGPFLLLGLAAVMTLPQVVSGQGNPGPAAPRGPKNVLVVNTKAQPVPVTGSVGISGNVGINGTPSVNAQQSGAWNVGINGTPTVNAGQSGAWNVGVSGNVGISGTPMVNAQQSGAWNVGINGTPNVQVNSSVASPLLIRNVNDGDEIFQRFVLIELSNGENAKFGNIDVPAGRRLVLEFVSVWAGAPMGQTAAATVNLLGGGSSLFIRVPLFKQGVISGQDVYSGAQQVRAYHEGGNPVLAFLQRSADTGDAFAYFSIAGYLTNAI